MQNYKNPLSIAGTGVILIIVGLAVKALIPRLIEVGAFVVTVGWIAIAVAVIIFIIDLIHGLTR